jgi:hypothetical protein
MPCTSWPGLDESKRKTRSGKEEIIWLAKIRAGNRRNPAVSEWTRTRRPQSKPRRARSGWPTSAGTTAPRISSSPVGSGSPAGAAGRWCIPRNTGPQRAIFRLILRSGADARNSRLRRFDDTSAQLNFPRLCGEPPHRFVAIKLKHFVRICVYTAGTPIRSDSLLPP